MIGPQHETEDVGRHETDEGDGAADRDGGPGGQRRCREEHGTGHADSDAHRPGLVVAEHEQVQVARHEDDQGGSANDERCRDADVLPGAGVQSSGEPEQDLSQRFVIGQEDDDCGDDCAEEGVDRDSGKQEG